MSRRPRRCDRSPEGRTRENVQRRAPAPRCREDRRRAPRGHRRRGGGGDARDAGSGGARLHRAREGQRERRCDRPGIERAQHLTRGVGEGPREGCPPHPRRVPPLRTLNHFSFLLLVLAVTIPTVVGVELPTAAGAVIGDVYKCRYTPSYLVFDEHGDLARTIIPDNVTPIANGYRVLDETGAVVSRVPRVTPELLVDLVRFTG